MARAAWAAAAASRCPWRGSGERAGGRRPWQGKAVCARGDWGVGERGYGRCFGCAWYSSGGQRAAPLFCSGRNRGALLMGPLSFPLQAMLKGSCYPPALTLLHAGHAQAERLASPPRPIQMECSKCSDSGGGREESCAKSYGWGWSGAGHCWKCSRAREAFLQPRSWRLFSFTQLNHFKTQRGKKGKITNQWRRFAPWYRQRVKRLQRTTACTPKR